MRAAAVVLAGVLAGCLGPSGVQFRVDVEQPGGYNAMPVVLGDQTGLVTGIESARGDYRGELPALQQDPDDPRAVIVSWGTGGCDDDTAMSLARVQAGFRMQIDVNEGFNLGCTAELLIRGLRIRFSEPVRADMIDVSGGR